MKLDSSKTEWDLSPLFKEDDDPAIEKKKKEVEEANSEFVKKWKGRDDYLENPEILKEALDELEKLEAEYGIGEDLLYYLERRISQDENDPNVRAKRNNANDFAVKLGNERKFFTLNLGGISEEKQKEFLSSENLKDYKHYLERLFLKSKYWLSEEQEKIMGLKHKVSHDNWVKMLSGILSREEREVWTGEKNEIKGLSDIVNLMRDTNKKVRDSAANAFNDILAQNVFVAENEINSVLQNKKINDELRGYERPESSRILGDDLEQEVVDNLVKAVSGKYDIARRFYELKAKLLGVEKLKYHERSVPISEIDKEYSWDECVDLVHKVLNNLDEEFGDIFKKFVENGQIDVFPKKGKTRGAYCSYGLKKHPSYILLNYTKRMEDVSTLAHETGHGINFELMKKQNSLDYEMSTTTAEVASTFMEDFVFEELLRGADDETKLSLMMDKLNGDVSSIIRQIACYEFERKLHENFREKGYLSKDEIGKLFQKHMMSYMGEYVEQSLGSENWWINWHHIRKFFYVYSYAFGLLISKSLQKKVRENKESLSEVKKFLSAGMSKSPKDIFLDTGIDITKKSFWDEGLQEIEDLLNETEELAKRLGKI